MPNRRQKKRIKLFCSPVLRLAFQLATIVFSCFLFVCLFLLLHCLHCVETLIRHKKTYSQDGKCTAKQIVCRNFIQFFHFHCFQQWMSKYFCEKWTIWLEHFVCVNLLRIRWMMMAHLWLHYMCNADNIIQTLMISFAKRNSGHSCWWVRAYFPTHCSVSAW